MVAKFASRTTLIPLLKPERGLVIAGESSLRGFLGDAVLDLPLLHKIVSRKKNARLANLCYETPKGQIYVTNEGPGYFRPSTVGYIRKQRRFLCLSHTAGQCRHAEVLQVGKRRSVLQVTQLVGLVWGLESLVL